MVEGAKVTEFATEEFRDLAEEGALPEADLDVETCLEESSMCSDEDDG